MKLTIDDLQDYVLDLLPNTERRKIDAEVARSPELATEAAPCAKRAHAVWPCGGCGTPRTGARDRVARRLSSGERYAPFFG